MKTFHQYNTLIFEKKLPIPSFRLTHARTFHGKLAYRVRRSLFKKECSDFELRISLDFDLPEKEWEDVVIHEMIHLYIAANGIEDTSSHGTVFQGKMIEINRLFNRHIKISAKSTPEQKEPGSSRIRGHYLCLAKFSDGRLGVAPAAKTRIFDLWEISRFFPNVVSYRWIGSTDPWFNRFPRVMKPKLYLTTTGELLPHLRGALILQKEGAAIRAISQRCSPDELLP
ncbi:MAG: SprT family zinc-dependent metalloprotease [Bacteroides sp.]|nr:SprT family zinc-dependent metalloprotease [Bacteroides sp.]